MIQHIYALIAQHDRCFLTIFNRINDLIISMDINEHIRYIGFPTINNIYHDITLETKYHLLRFLNQQRNIKINLNNNLYLQPSIFLFVSQHLIHLLLI